MFLKNGLQSVPFDNDHHCPQLPSILQSHHAVSTSREGLSFGLH
jgi:hypothetical protein